MECGVMSEILTLLVWLLLLTLIFWIANTVLDILWRDHDNREEEDKE